MIKHVASSSRGPLRARVAVAIGMTLSLGLSACGSTVRQDTALQQDGAVGQAGLSSDAAAFGDPAGPGVGDGLGVGSGLGLNDGLGVGDGMSVPAGASGSSPSGATGGTSGAGGGVPGAGVTAPTTGGRPGTAASGSTTNPGSAGTSGSTAPSGSAGPSGTAPTAGSPAGGAAPGGAAAGPPPGQAAAAGPATGRGFDETTVNIGYTRVDDSAGFGDSLGVSAGTTTIDPAVMQQAIVDDINANGGLAGRQINFVAHDTNAAEILLSPDNYSQAACATWTQDNQVFAVVGSIAYESLLGCLGDNDTPLIASGGIDIPRYRYQYFYDRYPLYLNLGAFVGEAYDRVAYRRLLERGFFEPWDTTTGAAASGPVAPPVKFGLIIEESEEGQVGAEHIAQVLADLGIDLASTIFIPQGNGTSAQLANAALQFRSDGITHVMSFAASFITSAESQGYYPRYFLEQSLNFYALSYSARSLNGAMGASFLPAVDSSGDAYPGHPNPAAYEPCLAVVQAAGVQPSSVLDHYLVQSTCDALYPLRDALAAAGGLSNEAVLSGFAALGDRPVSSITWTSRFGGSRRASAAAVRDISYVADCTCWRYDSATNHPAN